MSDAIDGNYELDDIDEDDLRSPLILEEGQRFNTSKGGAFFQFPVVTPRRSILKTSKPRSSPKQSIFLTVPGGHTAALPSPILPCSTPLPVHRVSFYGQQDSLPAEQSMTCPPTQFDTTKYKRSQYLSNLLLVLTDGLLPLVSIVSTLINVLELFLTGETVLGCAGLVIFAFPTVLVLFYYLENMFHREKKLLEMGLIVIFGPFLRWLCSVRLLCQKFHPAGNFNDLDDIKAFAFSTKVVDGIFQASVQIIWLLYLIAIEVYPFPLLNLRTRSVTDWFGNNLQIPVCSSLSLYSSIAVLVKNLSQLWRIHYPVSTDQNGSVTLQLQPKVEGTLKTICQWLLLVLFTSTGALYRLISYALLFLHLNLFMMPAIGIMIISTILHVILRGVSNKFYVETSKMDVFLTACCCCLVPTPTSSNIRAHNLLQAHNAVTNIFLLIAVLACIFFSIDYNVPIVRRPSRLAYSSDYFYNYCLLAVSLLPVSTLFYSVYKRTMGYPGLVRKTLFWRNRSPTLASVLTGAVSLILLASLVVLVMLGRHSSYQCKEATSSVQHGVLVAQDTGHGSRLECHRSYRPDPAPVIYCSWFFGYQGVLELKPLYYQELTLAHPAAPWSLFLGGDYGGFGNIAFMRNLSSVSCKKMTPSCQLEMPMCNATSLSSTPVPHGSWHCSGTTCALFCEPGYLSTGAPFPCTTQYPVPAQYCHLASLAVTNTTHTHTLSPDDDCSSTWEHKKSHYQGMDDHMFLCKTPADILSVNSSCQALDRSDSKHISFTGINHAQLRLVSYNPLPLHWLQHPGHDLASSHLTVTQEEECVVKVSHDTLLVMGVRTLLIKYTGPDTTLTYWVLPPLHYPRKYHACTLLGEGVVLVAGGVSVWREEWLVETEIINLNPAQVEMGMRDMQGIGSYVVPRWRKVGNIATPRKKGVILTVSGGCPLLVGGQGEHEEEGLAVEEFHLHTAMEYGQWIESSLVLRGSHTDWSVAPCGLNNCTGKRFNADFYGISSDGNSFLANERLVGVNESSEERWTENHLLVFTPTEQSQTEASTRVVIFEVTNEAALTQQDGSNEDVASNEVSNISQIFTISSVSNIPAASTSKPELPTTENVQYLTPFPSISETVTQDTLLELATDQITTTSIHPSVLPETLQLTSSSLVVFRPTENVETTTQVLIFEVAEEAALTKDITKQNGTTDKVTKQAALVNILTSDNATPEAFTPKETSGNVSKEVGIFPKAEMEALTELESSENTTTEVVFSVSEEATTKKVTNISSSMIETRTDTVVLTMKPGDTLLELATDLRTTTSIDLTIFDLPDNYHDY